MQKDYPIPASSLEREIEIKKSRFIARVTAVSSREDAMAFLAQARLDYPDARHHCWAYQIGRPGAATQAAMNDDGEPSGTAGKPILNVIQHKDMGDVMVVVIRYFGGVKLGAGGLVRAYAGATEAVLSEVPRQTFRQTRSVWLRLGFASEQPVRHWCSVHEAEVVTVNYGEEVTMAVAIPEEVHGTFFEFCNAEGIDASETH
ncbi:MAG: YigZ family protein [Alteromonadaceae bacterium]|nr:YigZ family protein [Alteromonadaceae bacterium]MBH83963.1 YigZ family protein [Alteromonadaceae bacterium]|tara:strand:- start:479 stop:1084 length:606 start_codon:yes stop_codon:yes gene_type:complete